MYYQDADFQIVDRVVEVAKQHSTSPAQIALAWMLSKPHITSPIIGATQMKHLDEAVAALEIVLSDGEIAYLEEPYQPHPILGHK
jgi:aryl-alcohol dehydrogenase (NADP+)